MSQDQAFSKKPSTMFYAAGSFFFPAAAAFAAIVIPWTLNGWFHGVYLPPGLQSPVGHAHEMLFGFALAVISGFLISRVRRYWLVYLAASWLCARLIWLLWPHSWLSIVSDLVFVALFLYLALPQFLVSVKKWRNHTTGICLVGLSVALIFFQMVLLTGNPEWIAPIRSSAVVLLTLLMTFMGGRMIAPAVAGHLQFKGRKLEARVQPRLESVLLPMLGLSILLLNTGWKILTALALFVSAVLILVRWLRWQWWHCLDRFDLLGLAIGYLWICIGLILLAWESLQTVPVRPIALHGLTVGALGCLTLTVMARTHMIRNKAQPSRGHFILPLTLLISLAAILRITLPTPAGLLTSGWLWSLAYAALFGFFLLPRSQMAPGKAQS